MAGSAARLRNGSGWVHPALGRVSLPPDDPEGPFQVADGRGGDPDPALIYLVDTADEAVVLIQDREPWVEGAREARVVALLHQAGFRVTVSVGPEATGAALARCYARSGDPVEAATRALWALKAQGGWDESPVMCFQLSEGERSHWVTARARGPRSVEVAGPGPSRWTGLASELVRRAATAVILADVDHCLAYNDGYGHAAGDLMLARLHSCLEAAAASAGAGLVRVEGDGFALLLDAAPAAAASLAERIRRQVEALAIPFRHAQLGIDGVVTVSVGVLAPCPAGDLRRPLEDAVDQAKRAGRNRVATGAID